MLLNKEALRLCLKEQLTEKKEVIDKGEMRDRQEARRDEAADER